ncbi:FecCD family ABC transporter permease [Paenibacillus albus]|uniref:Iron ABC transporter permease n=1 Tax=Paenibacillus albus TaxID=2495582 RepID=A0A3S8ZZ47_9BACL|nr:iron ABC transporter permease [Paenibacillus albus]AZN38789.1 iron ABC transporter permease [Paenibacillus albus]
MLSYSKAVKNADSVDSSSADALRSIYARPWTGALILLGGIALLLISVGISVSFGAADIGFATVWDAIFHYKEELTQHQIILDIRLPRVVGGALVGACFAVAGAMMQGMTRNPLADSGLLGLNAGAGFALAICFAFFPGLPYMYLILYSFVGAALGSVLVFVIGAAARGGLTPVRLVLAGATLSAMLTALSEGIALYYRIGQDLAFWYAGGVAGLRWEQLKIMFPWTLAALGAAFVLSKSITMLSLGEDVARGLGLRTGLIKFLATVVIIILAGAAVSSVGAVGFVGLLVPHVTRKLVGVDYRWIIPCSALLGALLVVFADLAARMVNAPYETPIGALIAIIGVPFFLYLAQKERREL